MTFVWRIDRQSSKREEFVSLHEETKGNLVLSHLLTVDLPSAKRDQDVSAVSTVRSRSLESSHWGGC